MGRVGGQEEVEVGGGGEDREKGREWMEELIIPNDYPKLEDLLPVFILHIYPYTLPRAHKNRRLE